MKRRSDIRLREGDLKTVFFQHIIDYLLSIMRSAQIKRAACDDFVLSDRRKVGHGRADVHNNARSFVELLEASCGCGKRRFSEPDGFDSYVVENFLQRLFFAVARADGQKT